MPRETSARFSLLTLALLCFALFAALEYFRLGFIHEFLQPLCTAHAEYCEGFKELARDLALGFFPIGLTIIFIEYLMRAQNKSEIAEYLEENVTSLLKEKLDRLDEIEASGLIAVRNKFGPEELERFVEKSKDRLLVLVPFFVDPERLEKLLSDRAKNPHFQTRIVLLHPASPYLRRRGEIVFGKPDAGKLEVEKTLIMLKTAFGSWPRPNAEVRVFDSLPTLFLAVADNRAMIGFFMNSGTALKNPHIEVRIRNHMNELTPLGKMIDREFSIALNDDFSRRVDLNVVSASDFTLPAAPARKNAPLATLAGNNPIL